MIFFYLVIIVGSKNIGSFFLHFLKVTCLFFKNKWQEEDDTKVLDVLDKSTWIDYYLI